MPWCELLLGQLTKLLLCLLEEFFHTLSVGRFGVAVSCGDDPQQSADPVHKILGVFAMDDRLLL